MAKEIPLSQGRVAMVDDEDFERLNQHKWCVHQKDGIYYALRHFTKSNGKKTMKFMHREILELGDHIPCVDHIDRDGLNNRRNNLRLATNSQNFMNKIAHRNASSAFKGVRWHKRDNVWTAQITLNKKYVHIGQFRDEMEAARAYDRKAKELFGEYARLNFK